MVTRPQGGPCHIHTATMWPKALSVFLWPNLPLSDAFLACVRCCVMLTQYRSVTQETGRLEH